MSETFLAPIGPVHTPPAPLLPLIGRTGDVADLMALLHTTRLITLLAHPALAKAAWPWKWPIRPCLDWDGVVFVPLADVSSPA